MFLIDYLKYDIVGKYYALYIFIMVIVLFALVGVIGEVETKKKAEIHRLRREKKAEEDGKKAEAAMAKAAANEFKKVESIIDPEARKQPVQSPNIPVPNPQSIAPTIAQSTNNNTQL